MGKQIVYGNQARRAVLRVQGQLDGFPSVDRFANDFETGLVLEESAKAVAKNWMVVGDDDTNRIR